MKKLYFLFLLILISFSGFSQNVTITKVIEAGCSSPFVKTVELYVDGTVNFATELTLNYMQNGAAWSENQIDVTSLGTVTDSFVYIVRDIALMEAEFPSTTFNASNTVVTGTATNGDDGYQVVLNGNVVSQFGRTETDADNDTESDWNHNDAVATRKDGIPDLGVWDRSHWDITAENDLDSHTSCQNAASTNLETYFATLGSTYSLGSGSGWTATGPTCSLILGSTTTSCNSIGAGTTDDTYNATLAFSGGNNGETFTVTSNAGTVGGDSPTNVESGTITITNIPEGTDITVTVQDTGVCDVNKMISSPPCYPLMINEVLFDPASDDGETQEVEGDANGDGTRDFAQDEFIEFYNNSGTPLDISGFKVYDSFGLTNSEPRHIFPASTVIPANSFLVLFGGGTPTGSFGGAIVQVASEDADPNDSDGPQLNLSNGGDVITVVNGSDVVVLEYNSGATGINHGDNQSVTRNPDFSATFALHSDANSNLAFSPGLRVDGTTLSTRLEQIENLLIYPNPVSIDEGILRITSPSSEKMNVVIYDLLGKQLKNQTVINNQVDISGLSRGVYLLKVSQANKLSSKRIIIQ